MGTLRRRLRRLSVGPRLDPARPWRIWDESLQDPGWRERFVLEEGDARPDLRQGDFAGRTLRGLDFSLCCVNGANFDGAELTGATFSGTELRNCTFVGAKLDRAVFEGVCATDSRLDRARLEGAVIVASNFAHSSFRHAVLDGAQLENTTFFSADLRNLSLRGARLASVDFEEADVSWATRGKPPKPGPHFSRLLPSYMSLLGLSRGEVVLRATEAAIEASIDVQADLRELISVGPDWRVHLVCACVAAMAGTDEQSRGALWARVEANSWASPQLVAALSLSDGFLLSASELLLEQRLSLKTRSAIAAVACSFPELDPALRTIAEALAKEDRIALGWLTRLRELTIGPGS